MVQTYRGKSSFFISVKQFHVTDSNCIVENNRMKSDFPSDVFGAMIEKMDLAALDAELTVSQCCNNFYFIFFQN